MTVATCRRAQESAKAILESLELERDYWVKKAEADITEQDLNEWMLDYPARRELTEAMIKADALNAAIARAKGET